MLPQNNPGRIRVVFDDHGLVANARLMLPPTLAQHLGLRELVHHHLDLGGAPGRANTGDNMLTLVVSALATGNCIANADARRAGGTAGPFPASSGLVMTSAWFARWPTPADMPLWASIERGKNFADALPSLVLGQAANWPCSVQRPQFPFKSQRMWGSCVLLCIPPLTIGCIAYERGGSSNGPPVPVCGLSRCREPSPVLQGRVDVVRALAVAAVPRLFATCSGSKSSSRAERRRSIR